MFAVVLHVVGLSLLCLHVYSSEIEHLQINWTSSSLTLTPWKFCQPYAKLFGLACVASDGAQVAHTRDCGRTETLSSHFEYSSSNLEFRDQSTPTTTPHISRDHHINRYVGFLSLEDNTEQTRAIIIVLLHLRATTRLRYRKKQDF